MITNSIIIPIGLNKNIRQNDANLRLNLIILFGREVVLWNETNETFARDHCSKISILHFLPICKIVLLFAFCCCFKVFFKEPRHFFCSFWAFFWAFHERVSSSASFCSVNSLKNFFAFHVCIVHNLVFIAIRCYLWYKTCFQIHYSYWLSPFWK